MRQCLRWFAAATAGATLLACGAEPPAAPDEGQPVRVMVVGDPAEAELPAYPGRAEATQEVNLSFEVEGRMLERGVELGDEVREGQVLAQLDLRDFQAALDRAKAVRDATATRLVRVRQAAAAGAVSQQDLSEAEARAEGAAAAVAVQQKALDDATLRAPFAGTVTATYAEPLQVVKERQPILRLVDASKIEMWVQVPEDRIARAPAERTVTVRFDALPGREFTAEIAKIGYEADEQTRTYPVELRIEQQVGENGEGLILPGMAGEATPKLPAGAGRTGSEVPLSAVFSDATTPSYVWVVETGGNTVTRRAVETGGLTNVGIVIRRGLQPGERIVTQGGQFLSDGVAVHVVKEENSS